MKKFSFWLFFYLLMMSCPGLVAAASVEKYYLAHWGWDGNDGLTTATPFGSVTKTVEVLETANASGETDSFQFVIAAGNVTSQFYPASAVLLQNLNSMASIEYFGDINGTEFTGVTGEVVFLDQANQDWVLRAQNMLRDLRFRNIRFSKNATLADARIQNVVVVAQSSQVLFSNCRLEADVSIMDGFLDVLAIRNSQNVVVQDGGIDVAVSAFPLLFRLINAQDNSQVQFQRCALTAQFPASSSVGPDMVILANNLQAVFANCAFQVQEPALANTSSWVVNILSGARTQMQQCLVYAQNRNYSGIAVQSNAQNVVLDSCGISQTSQAIGLNQSTGVRVQNCWLRDNRIGLSLQNALQTKVVNNLIDQNLLYGVQMLGGCAGSVLFNNLIVRNGPSNGGYQFYLTYLPSQDSPGSLSWRSQYNAIAPSANQAVGIYYGGVISSSMFNLKQWQEMTGQDTWGQSVSYSLTITNPQLSPSDSAICWGHGQMQFNGYSAPSQDYLLQGRPASNDVYPDPGCVEQYETSRFHHVQLVPAATLAVVGQTITAQAEFRDNRDQLFPMGGMSDELKFYFYLQAPGSTTQVEPSAIFSSPDIPLQLTQTAGLYYVPASQLVTSTGIIQLQVRRTNLDSGDGYYALRVVEWQDWYATAMAFGGRADNGSTWLRWVAPDQSSSLVRASSPVLASGQPAHYSLIEILPRNQDGTPITGLPASSFQFTVTGGTYILDLNTFREDLPQSGRYLVNLCSAQTGPRTLVVAVLGNTITPSNQIIFQSGVYGMVQDQASRQPVAGIQMTLYNEAGQQIALTSSSTNGSYSLLVPAPLATPYLLVLEDPQAYYPRTEYSLLLSANTALQENIYLTSSSSTDRLTGHAYPNPAPRGSVITLVYYLPRSGRLQIELYDLRGRRVVKLKDETAPRGAARILWSGVNQFGREIAPGTYVIQFKLDQKRITRKLVIIP